MAVSAISEIKLFIYILQPPYSFLPYITEFRRSIKEIQSTQNLDLRRKK